MGLWNLLSFQTITAAWRVALTGLLQTPLLSFFSFNFYCFSWDTLRSSPFLPYFLPTPSFRTAWGCLMDRSAKHPISSTDFSPVKDMAVAWCLFSSLSASLSHLWPLHSQHWTSSFLKLLSSLLPWAKLRGSALPVLVIKAHNAGPFPALLFA